MCVCVLEGGVVCFLSFIVTDFTLRFRIYFELNFLYGNKIKVDFFSYTYPVDSAPFVKKLFSLLNIFCIFA